MKRIVTYVQVIFLFLLLQLVLNSVQVHKFTIWQMMFVKIVQRTVHLAQQLNVLPVGLLII